MNTNPLISIIIPTYNGEKHITQTLNSIIAQDYENIEIILVDDVSTDDTVKISRKILENSGRKFQLIQRTINGRQSASRNTGLDASNGEYVIFIDHDDLVEKNFVSSLYKEAKNKNADIVFCKFQYYYEADKTFKPELKFPEKPLETPEDYLREWAKEKIILWSIWNCIFRKDFLKKNHLRFMEKLYIFEDREFILKAVALCSRISFIEDVLYTYVMHTDQQTKTDIVNRSNYKNFDQEILAKWRAGRCILKHTKDKTIRKYVFFACIARRIIRYCKMCIEAGDKERYDRITKTLHHKKIRQVLLNTSQKILTDPELFFNTLILIYFPNFYYWARSKKSK